MNIPVEDLTGELADDSSDYAYASIFFFPAGQKHYPYTRYPNQPHAGAILKYIKEMSTQYLKYDFDEDLGLRKVDSKIFADILIDEDVIKLKGKGENDAFALPSSS